MAVKCEMCGKGVQVGMSVPHSKHKTKKKFKPNLQNKTILIDGAKTKLTVCTSCLKKL